MGPRPADAGAGPGGRADGGIGGIRTDGGGGIGIKTDGGIVSPLPRSDAGVR